MLKDPGSAIRNPKKVGNIEDNDLSGIRCLGEEPVFLAGVDLSLKRGINIWIVQAWGRQRTNAMAAAAA